MTASQQAPQGKEPQEDEAPDVGSFQTVIRAPLSSDQRSPQGSPPREDVDDDADSVQTVAELPPGTSQPAPQEGQPQEDERLERPAPIAGTGDNDSVTQDDTPKNRYALELGRELGGRRRKVGPLGGRLRKATIGISGEAATGTVAELESGDAAGS
ncbi:hypothetical protein ACRE_089040 [Hapsidospora chrysogenum ATCC 11550]|uniref:Uncharacterized protein n=1 Tax=Hapsidospora chrysogenum (strain ATCC 11550 / CBS 779.69 / DSM 880 / IAM 14645 / JCM 23072 / IMI 49137) TaxID=857340 RepID=A0A086STJ2_HAPC1|nr:hypothetical protein ACRE_089040 [Hapsidospora chrysogenum ATCC 11550]